MRIKQLEITGFKSFVDRTVIQFDHDILGIVGPNGCGKSNIVDALRWCIGEQSAKHLRGRSMTDVIFAGSATRGPVGLAEVTITFDNSDPERAQSLPLEYRDYAEIAVTRRLYRDGTSEYLINKTQVRLKDITDLFLGTGVGTKAYSIIEQGKVGLIVSARPEDRRLFLEEAAGITKYKHRRKQTEQKMELTRQNLARVGDIVAEIERSMASLKRQAQKAERYKSYRAELDDLLLHEASHRFLELTALLQVERTALLELTEGSEAAITELATREAELEVARQQTYGLEEQAEKAQSEAYAAGSLVKTLEAEIAQARERLTALQFREQQAEAELRDLSEQMASVAQERESLEQQLTRTDSHERSEIEAIVTAQEHLDELRAQEQTAQKVLAELRARGAQAQARVASAEARLIAASRRRAELQGRREKLVMEADTLRNERDEVEARRRDLAAQVGELQEQKQEALELCSRLEVELGQVREEATIAEKELEVTRNELFRKKNRLQALEELHRRLEGVGGGARYLVNTRSPAVLGLVADFLEAPREWTHALAGLLGEQLQDVVIQDKEQAMPLLEVLARERKGRAAVRPVHPPLSPGIAPPEAPGVLGQLRAKLRYAPEHEALVRSLVGEAVVVESAAAALAIEGRNVPMVSLDGTVVYPNGRIVGGGTDTVAAGMLEQHREIRELHEQLRTLTVQVEEGTGRWQSLKERAEALQGALERARQRAYQAELAHATTERDLRRMEEQTLASARRLADHETELRDMEDRLAEASEEEVDVRALLDDARHDLGQSREGLDQAEAAAASCLERVAAQQALVTEQKVRAARAREQAAGLRATVARLGKSVGELTVRIQRLQAEMLEGARGAGQSAGILFAARERLRTAIDHARRSEVQMAEARQRFEEARASLVERETRLRELRARVSKLSECRTQREIQAQKLRLALDHLLDGVRERFRGLDLRRVIGDYHARPAVDEAHRSRTSELQGLLDRMGPVNLDAVKEYEEIEKRFTFYTTQRADLEAALADLAKAIEQMDRQSRKLFKETFESVNEKFQGIFPRMFRGGEARLQLTNPDDLLETGVEILAQPPGKKLGNIDLMSGGEKALTAVSLIFAIFQHRPSPFCVLDEVDAPLDEANVARYNEAIRSMTDKSQFILITHIKRTMQSVDVLYGVTMQEPGVSRLVSVKINDTAVRRSSTAVA
ncbi:MAG: chromosome segregation protein SMC [Myxococcales bacterium]|nr:chromosome segregation protein SMC [Polyangiaceae bacterium]MDW8251122.1 chromosome segregation protein SMC [Myxococcales bacterium]